MVVRIDPHETSSFCHGEVVQIPTLPLFIIVRNGDADAYVVAVHVGAPPIYVFHHDR